MRKLLFDPDIYFSNSKYLWELKTNICNYGFNSEENYLLKQIMYPGEKTILILQYE